MTMNIRPIRTGADYDAALKEIERLWGSKPGTPQGDRLDVLATLVEAYENEHYTIDAPDPVSAILFRMEQQELTRKDLSSYIGSRARVSEILGGKRKLTLQMIRRLHKGLNIPLESLISEWKPKKRHFKPLKNQQAARH